MYLTSGVLVLLMLTVRTHGQLCPQGCFCSGIYATCSGYSSFPESFHTSAMIVSIHRSSLPVIPAHALKGATNVTEIYIYESVIGEIQNCAFKGLKGLISLAIYNSDIDTIRSGAFSNITFSERQNTRFSIYQVNVETIEPYAFTDISNAKVFNIYQTNISVIESLAFYDLAHMPFFSIYLSNITDMKTSAFKGFFNINYISIYSSFIENLDCGTFDRFTSELGNGFSFYELEVNCDCNVAMLLIAARKNAAISIGRTRCRGPSSVAGLSLDAVNIHDICTEAPRVVHCPAPNPPFPEDCSPRRKTKIAEERDGAGGIADAIADDTTTDRAIFATGNIKDVSQIAVTELNTYDSVALDASTTTIDPVLDSSVREDSNVTDNLNATQSANDGNDLRLFDNFTDDVTDDDGKDKEGKVFVNKNSSVVIAVFTNRHDLMSVIATFLNYFFN